MVRCPIHLSVTQGQLEGSARLRLRQDPNGWTFEGTRGEVDAPERVCMLRSRIAGLRMPTDFTTSGHAFAPQQQTILREMRSAPVCREMQE